MRDERMSKKGWVYVCERGGRLGGLFISVSFFLNRLYPLEAITLLAAICKNLAGLSSFLKV